MNIYTASTVVIAEETYYIGLRSISGNTHLEIIDALTGKMISGAQADFVCENILIDQGVDDPEKLESPMQEVYYLFARLAEEDEG